MRVWALHFGCDVQQTHIAFNGNDQLAVYDCSLYVSEKREAEKVEDCELL